MPGMVPEDVYALTGVADPRLHPDGNRLAYVVWWVDPEDKEYRSAIWLTTLDGSAPPRKVTAGEKRDSSPRWSPDGTRLAFTSSRGEEKSGAQVFVLPLEGGEAARLTDLKEDAGELEWSPDGTRIAFSARVRDEAYEEEDDRKRRPRRFTRLSYKLDNVGWTGDRRQHLFVVAADGSGEARQVTSGDFEDASPSWSPDGAQLAFVSARDDDWDAKLVSDVYVVAADGSGEPRKLTRGEGSCEAVAWSPDGSQLAVVYSEGILDFPRHGRIAVVPPAGGDLRVLTNELDRTCSAQPFVRNPAWDGGRIVFVVEDAGNVHVYAVAGDGQGAPELLVGGEQAVTGFDVRDGRIVHTASTSTSLSELHAGDSRLSDVGAGFAQGRELGRPERFTARSEDGTEVDCWILRPAGFEQGKGQEIPDAPLDPRRPLLAVLDGLLRRVPGVRRRRLRGRLFESARLVRVQRGVGPRNSGPVERTGARLGDGRLPGPARGRRRGGRAVRLRRSRPAGSPGRLLRRLHDDVDRRSHAAFQGRVFRTGGQQPRLGLRLERRLLGVRRHVRLVPVRGLRPLGGALTEQLRREHRDAAARHALGERPPLRGRAGRAPVHHAETGAEGRRARPLPGRIPRALAVGLADPSCPALRDPSGLVRPLSQALTCRPVPLHENQRYVKLGRGRTKRPPLASPVSPIPRRSPLLRRTWSDQLDQTDLTGQTKLIRPVRSA
ncbi:MAG: S9 family peptidase [Actinobacteria bacterium]|nr:MAG: S9 family peptidase [Actinomycetota bacterium]